jgi:exodeoxyribonuclease-5
MIGTTSIELTKQQAEAGAKIKAWFVDGDQVFRLFGYAGTGKTSTARYLIDQLGVNDVQFAAYTGKAAYVLRTKGCAAASTIHSLVYLPSEKARARLAELTEKLDNETSDAKRAILTRQIDAEKRKLESPNWILREPEDTILHGADLLVIDEVSMVGERVALDLLSFGVKTLVLGDPAQLPPVDGGGWFIDAQPDHLLTEIHRSALDSPVTRIATTVRGAQVGERDYGITGLDGDSGRIDRIRIGDLLEYDQVLCGTNKTRWQAIHLLRALRGLSSNMPMVGDRIMVLANSGSAEVFNGQQFAVREANDVAGKEDRIRLEVTDDEGHDRELTCWRAGFTGMEGERQAKRDGRGSIAAATFGQAITVHKAQGSQWERVLVVDESNVFANIESKTEFQARRRMGLPDDGHSRAAGHRAGQRWLYTAATRAAEQIIIVPRLNGSITP